MKIFVLVMGLLLVVVPGVWGDGVNQTNLGPSVFDPVIVETIAGTDSDSLGNVFTFNFTVEVGPSGLTLLPAEWSVWWSGSLSSPATGSDYFSNDGAGFFPYGTPDQIPGVPVTPNQATLWSWGDFTCTEYDSFGGCANGTYEYNLEADQYGATIVDPSGSTSVGTPEPSTLGLLLVGLLGIGLVRRR